MASKERTTPKGLLTALTLFISVSFFTLATLFTVLILEIRNNQQQFSEQLATHGDNSHTSSVAISGNTQPHFTDTAIQNTEPQLAQLQQTLADFEERSRSLTAESQQQIQQKLDEITLQFEPLQEQQQILDQRTQFIAEQQQQSFLKLSKSDLATADKMAQMVQNLEQLNIGLSSIEQGQSNLDTIRQEIRQGIRQEIKQLQPTASQRPIDSRQLDLLTQRIDEQISQQQHSLQLIQSDLKQLSEKISLINRTDPTPAVAAEPNSPQLDQLMQKLDQLEKSQSQRTLLKPAEQSHTIEPYRYNAR
ncbi:MAG: hypothetical protein HON68_01095 [Gammaproteobacteria bacterium]|jgi:chromosome segregation ATPase|nr:hypothetical protein [Gammaproteobacteria bacterium]MBT3490616.1 hypothetical protein [Gammaproteobacteria bacterium]MBT3718032.1 hypothetical protein [Gammaproteobacteria bacterium]MBT3844883.1 hypothetical protein [Gammaproteobacteria bacterium]MBT3891976.1 hypothetical protein [Gammaproteobacteria bacterium]